MLGLCTAGGVVYGVLGALRVVAVGAPILGVHDLEPERAAARLAVAAQAHAALA